jgi:methylmalonyl-CoA/ethylmalonyl-CoA epimerase
MDPNDYQLHHVGYATPEIAKSRALYEDMGFSAVTPVFFDPVQKVRVIFFGTGTGVLVELVEPAEEKSPVSNFLQKRGPGLHHLCYQVSDIERACATMREKGGIITVEPVPAVAFEGRRIAFVFRREGLIELLERERR